ncbi:MAG: hypothetical protein J6Q33_01045 [Alistipes sp.]|nr:hypothetical protein [Alistipes sp.]
MSRDARNMSRDTRDMPHDTRDMPRDTRDMPRDARDMSHDPVICRVLQTTTRSTTRYAVLNQLIAHSLRDMPLIICELQTT